MRGLKVMIDVDLAALYGVPTKRLNEQVKRNRERFPSDFLFQLTADEKAEVVANCDHLGKLKFASALPFAFTEHGAIQAANVLASAQAVEMSQDTFQPEHTEPAAPVVRGHSRADGAARSPSTADRLCRDRRKEANSIQEGCVRAVKAARRRWSQTVTTLPTRI